MKKTLIILLFNFVLSAPILAQNWTLIDTNITHTNAALSSAYFTSDSIGYVVGGWGWSSGVILKTTDAGATWNLKVVTHNLQSVYFPSKDTGYAAGEHATVMKTIDGGSTWTYQNTSSVSSAYVAASVSFLNNDVGFVTLKNGPGAAFLKTHDGGTTWINDVSDTVHLDYFSVLNDSTVYGMYGELQKTTDGGNTWTNELLPTGGYANSLFFINDSTGFATVEHSGGGSCLSYSSLVKTTNAGQTWNETDYPCDFVGALSFPSNKIGYMVGTVNPPMPRVLWKTKDGGNTWLKTSYSVSASYDSTNAYGTYMVCTDTNTCYILTNYGSIIKTTNGGGATVGIAEEKNMASQIKIYPNPAQSQITIEYDLTETKNTSIEIKNILGQVVKNISNVSFQKGMNKIDIDVNDFTSGIYFLQVIGEQKLLTEKFVKQ